MGNSHLILKNTLFLYIRSIISLLIKLYTSRLVLEGLGIEEFGVYQVIGGLVAMFSFLNSTMASSTQRYLSHAIGLNDIKLSQKIFSTTINIHLIISLIIFILIESIGCYFLYNKINIGTINVDTAKWILHFTALSLVLTINSVPYNSLLISKEDMSYFAYIDILGELLKLFIGLSLSLFLSHRLIYYSFLMFLVTLSIRILYIIVCHKNYKESKYIYIWDNNLLAEMLSFSGWTTLSAISLMIKTQGLSILLNVSLGPLLNSALGIANQVNSAVKNFSQNFQMSFMPQIVKSYAREEYSTLNILIFSGAKLSTCLLLIISIPVMLEINYLLSLWLVNVPNYAGPIVIFLLTESILQCITCTGNTAIRATGNVKKYEIYYNLLDLLSLPISILILYKFSHYYIPFICIIIFTILSSLVKIAFLKKQIPFFNAQIYIKDNFIKLPLLVILSIIIPLIFKVYFESGIIRLILLTCSFEVVFILFLYCFAFNKSEKQIFINVIHKITNSIFLHNKK